MFLIHTHTHTHITTQGVLMPCRVTWGLVAWDSQQVERLGIKPALPAEPRMYPMVPFQFDHKLCSFIFIHLWTVIRCNTIKWCIGLMCNYSFPCCLIITRETSHLCCFLKIENNRNLRSRGRNLNVKIHFWLKEKINELIKAPWCLLD